MAWNEPENDDRKNDPWGSRPGKKDQGPPDIMVVIGGYNSSNTNHLATMSARYAPTFHIADATCIDPVRNTVRFKPSGTPLDTPEIEAEDWLPVGPLQVGVTAGASTPNNKIGQTVALILAARGLDAQDAPT